MSDAVQYFGNARFRHGTHAWSGRGFDGDRDEAIRWAREMDAQDWDVEITFTGQVDYRAASSPGRARDGNNAGRGGEQT